MHPAFIVPFRAGQLMHPIELPRCLCFPSPLQSRGGGALLCNGRQRLLHLLSHAGDEVHVVIHALGHTAVQLQLNLLLFAPGVQGVLGLVVAVHGAAGEAVLRAEWNTHRVAGG